MDIWVLDKEFNVLDPIIDQYDSLIWTDRYNSYGDFELCTFPDRTIFDLLQKGRYLWIGSSEHTMIVEDIETITDSEEGNTIKFTGRSLESILYRRIIWSHAVFSGTVKDIIKQLLDENVISPSDANRKIPNFVFQDTALKTMPSTKIEVQFYGSYLYESIESLCKEYNLGFKVILSDDNQFVFSLYEGTDRSYDQFENVNVVFSPQFDNLVDTNFVSSDKDYKNVALVAGEGEGDDRKTTTVTEGSKVYSGLDRREMFVDARDISSTVEDTTLSADEYTKLLVQRGNEKLSEAIVYNCFEGEIDSEQTFRYGVDFFSGDIIQLVDEYGNESKSRVTEVIISQDETGTKVYPTIESI